MRALRVAIAVGAGLLALSPGYSEPGYSDLVLGPVAAEIQARLDALTGDLDRAQLKQQKALQKAQEAMVASLLTDDRALVARAALAVDKILRKAFKAEFVPPGSEVSPLPGLSRDMAEALYDDLDRVHWRIVSHFATDITRNLARILVKGDLGKARAALAAAASALDADEVPRALKKIVPAAAGIAPWDHYEDLGYLNQGLTAFLGREDWSVRGDLPCGPGAMALDLEFGTYDVVSEEFTVTGALHVTLPAMPETGLYPLASDAATWQPAGSETVWTSLPGGTVRVVVGNSGTTPFVAVFEFDLTDGNKVLPLRYGVFVSECASTE